MQPNPLTLKNWPNSLGWVSLGHFGESVGWMHTLIVQWYTPGKMIFSLRKYQTHPYLPHGTTATGLNDTNVV